MTRGVRASEWSLAVAMVAVAVGGCGEEARRGTPEIVNFVTPKKDPDFVPKEAWEARSGVGVVQPGRGWELGAWDAGRVTLAHDVDGCRGWVETGPAREGDPRAEGERRLAAWCDGAEGCRVVEENFALYNGKTGWRWEGSKPVSGGRTEMGRTTVVVNPGPGEGRWVVAVESRGVARDYGARRRCLDAITAAVGLGEAGEAPPALPASPAPPAVLDASGGQEKGEGEGALGGAEGAP